MATAATAATAEELELAGGTLTREQVSLWVDSWRRFRRNRLALGAAVYLFLLGVIAIVGIFWTPYSMSRVGLLSPYAGPTLAHPLGADSLGRDILSRLMLGVQVSLIVGLGTQVLVIGVGVVIGLVAGYFRGIIDTLITLVINVFYGVPDLLVALVLVVLLGSRGLIPIIVAISATRWMDMARLVRGQALSIREREYVEAARASGARPHRILFGHIFPNALGPIIVQATFGIPTAILFEAFLSFLGVGVAPPTPSWGSMAAEGVAAIRLAPHIVLAPSIALSVTLLAFNFLGDGLRDAFDPRQKR
jgi:oligopeptide transport system permease protein